MWRKLCALPVPCYSTAAPARVGDRQAVRLSPRAGGLYFYAKGLGFVPTACTAVSGFGLGLLAGRSRAGKDPEIGPSISTSTHDRQSRITTSTIAFSCTRWCLEQWIFVTAFSCLHQQEAYRAGVLFCRFSSTYMSLFLFELGLTSQDLLSESVRGKSQRWWPPPHGFVQSYQAVVESPTVFFASGTMRVPQRRACMTSVPRLHTHYPPVAWSPRLFL